MGKKKFYTLLSLALMLVLVAACSKTPATNPPAAEEPSSSEANSAPAEAEEAPAAGDQIVIYMQMGGNQGDPSTLARTNGAKAAAADLGIKLIEQYSGWDPQTMIEQFKEAVAAQPDGIVIMGHPVEDAFEA
ncbi:MAG: hypothetical protein P8Z42_10415, partial [Anaerolineales bacterium]